MIGLVIVVVMGAIFLIFASWLMERRMTKKTK